MRLGISLLLAATLMVGCNSMSITVSELDNRGERVTAKKSKFSFFWLSPINLEEATALVDELVEKCDGGPVTGVTSRTSAGWAVIGQVETFELVGYCEEE